MIALSVALIVASTSTAANPYRENKTERAARLMTDEDRAQLASLAVRLDDLRRPAGNAAVFGLSIATLSVGLAVPVVLVAAGLVATIFVGLVGVLVAAGGSTSVLAIIPAMWVSLFSWVPVVGWLAIGGVTLAGVAMMVGAQMADAPRREQIQELKLERRRIVNAALSRPEPQPMTTVLTF